MDLLAATDGRIDVAPETLRKWAVENDAPTGPSPA